jgi:hypothetical protein
MTYSYKKILLKKDRDEVITKHCAEKKSFILEQQMPLSLKKN